MEVVGTVRITSISLRGSSSRSCGYVLGIFTQDRIGSNLARAIRHEWQESIFCRKRRIAVKNNEIKIQLKKGDTIQKYIDCISGIINKVKSSMKPSRQQRLKQRAKNMKLRKDLHSKVYHLASAKKIKEAL